MLVKRIFLVLHETDTYRQDIKILLDVIAQSLDIVQTGGILLCRDDELRRWHGSKRVVDELYVLLGKLMVVSEGKWREVRGER